MEQNFYMSFKFSPLDFRHMGYIFMLMVFSSQLDLENVAKILIIGVKLCYKKPTCALNSP